MVDAEGAARLFASTLLQVLVHDLRQKRHNGREEPDQGRKHSVERLVGRQLVFALFAFPKAATVSAHIPVAELFGNESFRRKTKGHHVVVFELAPGSLDEQLQVRQNPAVDVGPLTYGNRRGVRIEAIQSSVVAEESVGVPKLQNKAISNLVRRAVAEIDVVGWIVPGKHPTHYIDPHFFCRFLERYGVALGLMHLLAFFVPYNCMPQEYSKGGSSLHQRAHSEEGVKPVAKLAGKAFGNEVRRKPLLPVLAVAVVPQGRVGHDAGIEPRVADIRNPACPPTAFGTANFDQIDPWPVRRVTVKFFP